MKHDFSKGTSLALVAGMYVLALGFGVRAFAWAVDVMPEVWALLVADIVMTVLIWGFGLAYENVSIYDPYWSVIPPTMFTAWALYKHCFTLPVILLLVTVWWWGIRLTGNWVWTFKGIGHEDWRYTRYREKQSPFLFQVTNFFGLNMVPTLVVFACMLPGFGLFEAPGTANALWKRGRHPNYFGEVMMWWGVWLMYASLRGIDWLMLAPFAMTDLFLFISIPMMERRQLARKPAYAAYRKRTRLFI